MVTDLPLIFKNLGIAGLDLIAIPFFLITVLTYLNRNTKQHLAGGFGMISQLYLGFIGIFLHELSHLLMAIFFGHRIVAFRLLKRPHPDQPGVTGASDMTLGYVNHTWNQRNWYQTMGNLFIGIAPIFGCALALFGLTALLLPGVCHGLLTLMADPFNLNWSGFGQPVSANWWRWILMIVLSLNISIGGFDLSNADFANSKIGVISFIMAVTAITVLLTMANAATGYLRVITALAIWLILILGYALVISLLTNLTVRLILRR